MHTMESTIAGSFFVRVFLWLSALRMMNIVFEWRLLNADRDKLEETLRSNCFVSRFIRMSYLSNGSLNSFTQTSIYT